MTDTENRLFRSLFEKFRQYASKCKDLSDNQRVFLTLTMAFGWLCDEPVYREEFEKFVKYWDEFVK